MQPDLEAFIHEWETGDREKARHMAKEYVASHRETLEPLIQAAVRQLREARLEDPPTKEDLVALVSAYRNNGDTESANLIKLVVQAGYGPQKVAGSVRLSPLLGDGRGE